MVGNKHAEPWTTSFPFPIIGFKIRTLESRRISRISEPGGGVLQSINCNSPTAVSPPWKQSCAAEAEVKPRHFRVKHWFATSPTYKLGSCCRRSLLFSVPMMRDPQQVATDSTRKTQAERVAHGTRARHPRHWIQQLSSSTIRKRRHFNTEQSSILK